MTDCKTCGFKKQNDGRGYKRTFCDKCIKDKKIGVAKSIEKVFLKGYGWELKSRLKEMDRRVILPYKHPDGQGSYYLGRREDSGKVSERHPDY